MPYGGPKLESGSGGPEARDIGAGRDSGARREIGVPMDAGLREAELATVSSRLDRAAEAHAAVAAVAAEIAAVRQALRGAENTLIEECLPRLERAAETFQIVFGDFNGTAVNPQRLRRDLAALRRDLRTVAGLAQSGAALYQGLSRLLGAATGGYTPKGHGVPLQPALSLLLKG